MNHLPLNGAALGMGAGSGTQTAIPVEEMAMLSCERDGQLQSFTATILFVEDEAFVREVAGKILRSAGYRVWRARSTEEALVIYKKCGEKIDLLLTDIVLPGASGPVLAKKLRAENPGIRILFTTGYVEKMGNWNGDAQGEYLAKPFSAQALLQRVRQVLDERGKTCGNGFRHAAGSV
jgi:two-component system cell cycle sensor histidine kinase/response regulator CckA